MMSAIKVDLTNIESIIGCIIYSGVISGGGMRSLPFTYSIYDYGEDWFDITFSSKNIEELTLQALMKEINKWHRKLHKDKSSII